MEDTSKRTQTVSSIPYYEKNARLFYERSINVDQSALHKRFLEQLNPSVGILDVGCGVGRDARIFEELGHHVTALDGSQKMVDFASQILKEPARVMLYEDMDFSEEFDGVWAAAALIHVSPHDLKDVLNRIYRALKPGGILFANFMHGKGEYTSEERTFYYMTEDSLRHYLEGQFNLIDVWTTEARSSKFAHSPDKMWLNVLAKKH
jgi:SAM-dependent methyltransferase